MASGAGRGGESWRAEASFDLGGQEENGRGTALNRRGEAEGRRVGGHTHKVLYDTSIFSTATRVEMNAIDAISVGFRLPLSPHALTAS